MKESASDQPPTPLLPHYQENVGVKSRTYLLSFEVIQSITFKNEPTLLPGLNRTSLLGKETVLVRTGKSANANFLLLDNKKSNPTLVIYIL